MNPDQALARVSVLIVNYNAGDWLARSVEPLLAPETSRPEIIIVDNGSSDDSLEQLAATVDGRGGGSAVTIDRAGRNLGFAAGINRAAGQATRELLLLLNPDCRIEPAALARLVAELDEHPEAALVSGKVVGVDGREQRASRRRLPTPALIMHEMLPFSSNGIDLTHTPPPNRAISVEAVSGACMLIRAEVFHALDGLDESYPMHFEDLDLFRRLLDAGHAIRWLPGVEIVHAGGRSSRSRPAGVVIDKHRGLWRYLARHCSADWPRWQRPFWALALVIHLVVRLAIALVSRR
ncbi:MAG: glycosyltransferase family 2 protein [Wenzhouxiangellaceae bacterium]